MLNPSKKLVVFLVAFVVVALPPVVGARTLSVCAVGCAYASAQAALAAANPAGGDVIRLSPGVYIGPVQVGINVEIQGAGADATTVVGGLVVGGNGILVGVHGVTLAHGLNGLAVLGRSRVIVQDSAITANLSDGVLVADESDVTLFNTSVVDNGSLVSGNPIGAGISVNGHSRVVTSIVRISGNVNGGVAVREQAILALGALTEVIANGSTMILDALQAPGILVAGQSSAVLNAVVVDGNAGVGIAVYENGSATILNAQVASNGGAGIQIGGLPLGRFDAPHTASATVENTKIFDNNGYGVLIGDPRLTQDAAEVTLRQNGITGNAACGIGVDAAAGQPALLGNFVAGNAASVCTI